MAVDRTGGIIGLDILQGNPALEDSQYYNLVTTGMTETEQVDIRYVCKIFFFSHEIFLLSFSLKVLTKKRPMIRQVKHLYCFIYGIVC